MKDIHFIVYLQKYLFWKNRKTSIRGFSLTETVLVTGMFALIMVVIMSSILYFYRSNANTVEQVYAVESARRGIEFMVRDIREAAFADNGAYPISLIGDNEFLFYSDIDRDESVERVRYRLNGSILEKGVTNASGDPAVYDDDNESFSIVSSDVRNQEEAVSVFSYFDDGGTQITDFNEVTNVTFVSVFLIVNISPTRLPEEFVLRSSATLRNLKTNL